MTTLVGEFIVLRPMRADDAKLLFESASEKQIWEFTSKKVSTLDGMEAVVKGAVLAYEKGTELPFVIERRTDGKVLGSTRFTNIDLENGSLEIGWTWLHPSVWRTIVNTEAKRLLLTYAFETLGIRRVQFCVDGRNERSQRAVKRLGAVQEGILRKHRIVADDFIRDTVVFSILDSEWDEVKLRFECASPPELSGKVIDEMSRCEHYHQEVDVIS
ncbi:MAG: GNAT family N-acetyltransferase, partial [Bacilli bacterium]